MERHPLQRVSSTRENNELFNGEIIQTNRDSNKEDNKEVINIDTRAQLKNEQPKRKELEDFIDEDDENDEDDYEYYEKPRRRGISIWTKFKLFFLLLLVVLVAILYFKPSLILNPIKSYINSSYGNDIPSYGEFKEDDLENLIKFEDGKGEIILSEDQIVALLNQGVVADNKRIDRVEVMNDKIIFMTNLVENDYPLWLAIEVSKVEGKYQIHHFGFGRFGIPEGLKEKVIQRSLDSILSVNENNAIAPITEKILGNDLSSLIDGENVVMEEDKLKFRVVETEMDPKKFINELFKIEI